MTTGLEMIERRGVAIWGVSDTVIRPPPGVVSAAPGNICCHRPPSHPPSPSPVNRPPKWQIYVTTDRRCIVGGEKWRWKKAFLRIDTARDNVLRQNACVRACVEWLSWGRVVEQFVEGLINGGFVRKGLTGGSKIDSISVWSLLIVSEC